MSMPIVNTISVTLLAIIVPVFIFAVTLLGSAISKAQTEESKAKEQQKKDFELKINDMDNKIKTAKKTGDPSCLEIQLRDLVKNKKKFERQLGKIQGKYSLIKFKESVVFPGGFFVLSILANEFAKNFTAYPAIVLICWIFSLSFMGIAINRILKCLSFIQEISISSQEYQKQKMVEAFVSALELHEEKNKAEIEMSFREMTFPYHTDLGQELIINFRVMLKKGNIAENVLVWFFVPDGFELVSPEKFWNQPSDYVVPNIRTVAISIGKVSKGLISTGTLKIRCPQSEGKYFLMYNVLADGYFSERSEAEIIVETKKEGA